MLRVAALFSTLIVLTSAVPTSVGVHKSISIDGGGSAEIPQLFSFDRGGVGVNFLGFKASAGLGGLLTGNTADGGLHAEAGTPFGQAAGAGLGGTVAEGKSVGGLYAGATAGGGVSAGAGIAGDTSSSGSYGRSYAGASAGGVTKIKQSAKVIAPIEVHKEVETIEVAKPQTTYVERTVIPNYVEKTIQVPSYVEKTIRVPTVIEKRIKVPAEPTVIEKTVEAPASGVVSGGVQGEIGTVKVVEKTRIHHHPHHHRAKVSLRKNIYSSGGYGGGFGGGFGGGYDGGYGGTGSGSYSATVTKTANPQLFRDIFNIPIQTLGAVSNLVSGIAGGTSGSFAVSKSFSAYS